MTGGSDLIARALGALRLDDATYEAIEADKKATGEAAFIVVATSLVSGAANGAIGGASSGFAGALGSFVGWAFYAWVAYIVGTKLFPGKDTKAEWGEIARTLGYANTPRFVILLILIPGLEALVRGLVSLWVLASTVVALRTALDISTGRAIAIGIASVIGQLVVIASALIFLAALIP